MLSDEQIMRLRRQRDALVARRSFLQNELARVQADLGRTLQRMRVLEATEPLAAE